ncbi:metalloregulator ArsR/SmtB family transcription factor [Erythrobacter sp. SCSIO 43205]|uniref:ArsR/SmtB family transcription factor n=1 Tax=Erythrobacter sp. SCSIO 43205 TaxID=2779361 RepID=UPI001CAA00EB|nr:metalloregulator ArsR/SmtB family transcription factor [Erythrobacter sp. SCSIO 43205]UAB78077.1 metalloregulator ArsR/SmtB family transcription factor [Erythrobacter sp. SCSIO 43205]
MVIDAIFKALADPTRLRIARLLSAMELAVGELAQVLGQSQPRVSRHVGILCDAGLAERRREGSWVFLRAVSGEEAGPVLASLDRLLATAEAEHEEFAKICADDRRKLAAIREAREANAEEYFAAHASEWDELRALHTPDAQVEELLLEALGKGALGSVLDIGTGTGRMAELFASHAEKITALDKNLEMMKVARAKLQNLPTGKVDLVQGDFANLPFAAATFDNVLLHQVLHFAQDPSIPLAEAARVIKDGGRIAIVDFADHNNEDLRHRYQHARLGFSDEQMTSLLRGAGFEPGATHALAGGELVVKIWIATRKGSVQAHPIEEPCKEAANP